LIVVAIGNVMRPFIAFIRKQTGLGFRVSFPDLPDCNSTGPTIAEARRNAEHALTLHCRRLKLTGARLPRPSYMHQIAWTQERILDGLVVLIAPPEAA
jgi:predicted RNase H-like HicB family nuclease